MNGPTIRVEAWIRDRLDAPALFGGLTTPEERRERVRDLILGRGLEFAIAGRREGGKCETWSDLFARIYGEPLTKPNRAESAA